MNELHKTFKWPWKIKVSTKSSKFCLCASLKSCDLQILGIAWKCLRGSLSTKKYFFPRNFELCAKFCGVQSKPGWWYVHHEEPAAAHVRWTLDQKQFSGNQPTEPHPRTTHVLAVAFLSLACVIYYSINFHSDGQFSESFFSFPYNTI